MITFKQYFWELYKPEGLSGRSDPNITNSRNFEIEAFMKKNDFYPMGSGLYARVFMNKKYPYIIKVFEKYDKGYLRYLEFMKKNQNNKYVPKIKGSVTKINYYLNYIRLEKLLPLSRSEYLKFLDDYYKDDINDVEPELREVKMYIGGNDDIHDENIMKRPNGQIVITDPLG